MMDYDQEISALKKTVFELLDREEKRTLMFKKIRTKYREVLKHNNEIESALMRKDVGFQELNARTKSQQEMLEKQIDKLNELEDVLEDMT